MDSLSKGATFIPGNNSWLAKRRLRNPTSSYEMYGTLSDSLSAIVYTIPMESKIRCTEVWLYHGASGWTLAMISSPRTRMNTRTQNWRAASVGSIFISTASTTHAYRCKRMLQMLLKKVVIWCPETSPPRSMMRVPKKSTTAVMLSESSVSSANSSCLVKPQCFATSRNTFLAPFWMRIERILSKPLKSPAIQLSPGIFWDSL